MDIILLTTDGVTVSSLRATVCEINWLLQNVIEDEGDEGTILQMINIFFMDD
jgi:hypothetical protein